MKQLNKILIAVVLIIGLNAQAQDSKNPWAVSFGMNALDTRTSAGGGSSFLDSHFSDAFSVKNNWNIVPTISYIGVSKYVGDNFSFGISGSVNKINKAVYFDPTATGHDSRGYIVTNPGDLMYYGIDATVKYSFMSLIKSKVIDPSLSVHSFCHLHWRMLPLSLSFCASFYVLHLFPIYCHPLYRLFLSFCLYNEQVFALHLMHLGF